jgi:cysteine desulfurase/selenocysteine lyase
VISPLEGSNPSLSACLPQGRGPAELGAERLSGPLARPLDFYAAAERRPLLRPLEVGWNSVAHRREWDNPDLVLDDTARRFEGGTQPVGLILGLGASIGLLLDAGVEEVWRHVDGLSTTAAEGLARVGARVFTERGRGRSAS